MKREVIILILILTIILTLNHVSAGFTLGNLSHSIDKQYSQVDIIKGWINISLINQPTDSLFKTNFEDSISLIDLLILNNAVKDDTCIPTDCETDYSEVVDSKKSEKNFNLNAKEEKIVGFKIDEVNFDGISYFSLNVTSDASESENQQLKIDILNDEIIEWESYKASQTFRERNYGCYDFSASGQAEITETEYCGVITLPITPNVSIGAKIVQGTGNAEFKLSIDDQQGKYDFCYVTASSAEEISCSPKNFRITKAGDFHVCINAIGGSEYNINYEINNPCGYAGSSDFDFEIFARPASYAPIGNFILDDTELKKFDININDYIDSYIYGRYKNICSGGCIIPIKFISNLETGETQNIDISNIELSYTAGIATSTDELSDLIKTPARVNFNFQMLSLDEANLRSPISLGNHTFTLYLDDSEIFSEEIHIEKTQQILSLNPKIVIAAYPTNFSVKVETLSSSGTDITNYKWEFGDGDTETTLGNSVVHTYDNIGEFNLTVSIIRSLVVISSRTFKIAVEIPKEAVDFILANKIRDLDNLKSKIESLPSFHKNSMESVLNITGMEEKLREIQEKNESAFFDEDYLDVMKDLMSLVIPEDIATTVKAPSLSFFPQADNINLDVLKKISQDTRKINDESRYIDAINAWNHENIDAKIDFEEFSAVYDDFDEPILKIFNLKITKKTDLTYNPYLIIYKLGNLKFEEDYSEKEVSEYFYIELADSETSVTFSTTEDVDFIDVPVFISPTINKLSLINIPSFFEEKSRIILITAVMFGLLLIGFFVYVVLQQWYKKKYESHLFKNRNDLYNLVSYIQNSKKAGAKEKVIFSRLKKVGWKPEQVKYVMKKYVGKRTGMLEVPVERILGKFKKKEKRT